MNPQEFVDQFNKAPPASAADLAKGMHLCYKNGAALLAEARTLRDSSPGRALALAILALEEIAKIFVLAEFVSRTLAGPIPGEEIRKALRSHRVKQLVFALYGTHVKSPILSYETEIPAGLVPLLDRFKQLSLYVDLTTHGFLDPGEFGRDNIEWVDWLIAAVTERLDSLYELHSTEEASTVVVQSMLDLLRKAASAVRTAGGLESSQAEDAVKGALREFLAARRAALERGDEE